MFMARAKKTAKTRGKGAESHTKTSRGAGTTHKRSASTKKIASVRAAPKRRPSRPAQPVVTSAPVRARAAASMLPANYAELVREFKAQVRSAQIKAATSVNEKLIALYLHIGRRLAEQDEASGWGEKVVERLAKD